MRKRPILRGHLDHVRETVERPQIVIEKDGEFYFYRLGYGSGQTQKCYLQVLIKYDGEQSGAIRTAWFSPTVEEGAVKWLENS